MPTFPDGSRIWLADIKGTELTEYNEESGTEESTGTTCEWRKVYVTAAIGKAFAVHYQLPASDENKRRLEVALDGLEAADIDVVTNAAGSVQGWTSSAEKIDCFAFGELDIIGNGAVTSAPHDDPSEYLIEGLFYDAIVDGPRKAPTTFRKPILAGAVRSDSKVAKEVGCQIKTGWVLKYKPNQGESTGPHLAYKPGAIEYCAQFIYRPEKLLVALGVIPDPNLPSEAIEAAKVKSKRKRKTKTKEDVKTSQNGTSTRKVKETPKRRTLRSEFVKREQAAKDKANGVTKGKLSKSKEEDDDRDWEEVQEAKQRAAKRKAAQKAAQKKKQASAKPKTAKEKVSNTSNQGKNSAAVADGQPEKGDESSDDLSDAPTVSTEACYLHA